MILQHSRQHPKKKNKKTGKKTGRDYTVVIENKDGTRGMR